MYSFHPQGHLKVQMVSEAPARVSTFWLARRRKKQEVHSPFPRDAHSTFTCIALARTYMVVSGYKGKLEMKSLFELARNSAKNKVLITEREEKDNYWGITRRLYHTDCTNIYPHLKIKRNFISLHICHN